MERDVPGAARPAAAQVLRLLEAASSLAPIGGAALADLVRMSPVDRADAGETLFRQGDPGDFAWLVLDGRLGIEVETPAGRVTVARVGPGGLVGEIAAFAATPRTASVICLEPASLLRIEQGTIRGLLARNPAAAMAIIADLGTRLQSLNGSIATLIQATTALARGTFDPDMLAAMRSEASRFSHFAAAFEDMAHELTEKRQRSQEMHLAAEIQRSFLPAGPPGGKLSDRFDVAAVMLPAKEVGGDFYDYFRIDDDRIGFAVGDVSGKGVPASMFMSVARTVLKTIAREGHPAGEVLRRMNQVLAEDNTEAMFVTVAYGRLHLPTGRLDYATAGHEEAYFLTAEGVEKVAPMGPAVGLFPQARFAARARVLAPRDMVVFATDGITEAFGPGRAMFGNARLEAALADLAGADPAGMVQDLAARTAAFAAGEPQSDDLTCLALRFLSAPG